MCLEANFWRVKAKVSGKKANFFGKQRFKVENENENWYMETNDLSTKANGLCMEANRLCPEANGLCMKANGLCMENHQPSTKANGLCLENRTGSLYLSTNHPFTN